MRALIQRVSEASVTIDQVVYASIQKGLLVFIGIEEDDDMADIEWLANKIVLLRIFSDDAGLMNKSVLDVFGNILIVSQFTLCAQTKKGNRPSFIKAARHEKAIPLYNQSVAYFKTLMGEKVVKQGQFGADMKIALVNDGPVTIWMDSKNKE